MENSQIPQDFETYLKTYPNGAFAPQARQRLAGIQAAARKLNESMPNLTGTWNCKGSARVKTDINDVLGHGEPDHEERTEAASEQISFEQDGRNLHDYKSFLVNGSVVQADPIVLDGVERMRKIGPEYTIRVTAWLDGEAIVLRQRGGLAYDEEILRYSFSADRNTMYIEENSRQSSKAFSTTSHTSEVCGKEGAAEVDQSKQSVATNVRKLAAVLDGAPLVKVNSSNSRWTTIRRLVSFDSCAATVAVSITLTSARNPPWVEEQTLTIPFQSLVSLSSQTAANDGMSYGFVTISTAGNDIKVQTRQPPTMKMEANVQIEMRDRADGNEAVRIMRDIAVGCQGKLPVTDEADNVFFLK
jgi:hypothetical protein